ncbi:MAG: beta-ketoacyl-ACP reductase [Anaerolineales bacterium]|nr:beta-ketoacyl-ACP reductase [Anaerolineales bacterium]
MGNGKEFQGKWAVVTGGSRGIGHAIALDLAKNGANVSIVYLEHHGDADTTLKQLNALNIEAEKYQTDVSDHQRVQETFSTIIKNHGAIEILVNCAGINRDKSMSKLPLDLWQQVIDTNLTGAYNCIKATWDHMKEKQYGRVISISSIVGQAGNFGQVNYAASKSGLLGMTKSLALEGARNGITVNAICPGFINTDMVRGMPDDVLEKVIQRIPVGRLGTPEEVARAVSFLASPQSGFITGQVINVNGGQYM